MDEEIHEGGNTSARRGRASYECQYLKTIIQEKYIRFVAQYYCFHTFLNKI